MVSRDVVFWEQPHTVEEEVCPSTLSSAVKVTHLVPVSKAELQNEEEYFEEQTPPTPQHALAPQGKPLPKWARQLFDEKNLVPDLAESSADELRRSKRIEEQKRAFEYIVNMALMAEIMKVQEPTNLEKAMADPNWKAVMQEEYDSIMKNQSWNLVDCLIKRKIIGTKWVWKAKYKSDGSLENTRLGLLHKDTLKLKALILRIPLLPQQG